MIWLAGASLPLHAGQIAYQCRKLLRQREMSWNQHINQQTNQTNINPLFYSTPTVYSVFLHIALSYKTDYYIDILYSTCYYTLLCILHTVLYICFNISGYIRWLSPFPTASWTAFGYEDDKINKMKSADVYILLRTFTAWSWSSLRLIHHRHFFRTVQWQKELLKDLVTGHWAILTRMVSCGT